jgi:hypothetical protein
MYLSVSGRPNLGKSTLVQALCARAVANVKKNQRLLPVQTFSKTGVPNGYYASCVKALCRVFLQPVAIKAWRSSVLPEERLVIDQVVSAAADATANDAVKEAMRSIAMSTAIFDRDTHNQERDLAQTLRDAMSSTMLTDLDDFLAKNSSVPRYAATQYFALTEVADPDINHLALMGESLLSALIDVAPAFATAVMDVAKILREYAGSMVSVRTENMPMYHGARFCAKEARRNEFEAVFPGPENRVVRWTAKAHPIDLIKASALFSVVHVGTLDNRFEADISSATTMSGGMSQAILLSGQDLSDTSTYVGGQIITEIRDDYTKSRNDELSDILSVNKVDDSISRFMGTSEVALHIVNRGEGVLRRRSFTAEAHDFTNNVSWTLDEIRQGRDVVQHLRPEPNDYAAAAEAGKVTYAKLEFLRKDED